MPLRLGRVSDERMRGVVDAVVDAPFSYPEVGATRDGALPSGYRVSRYSTDIPGDGATYGRAVEALKGWQAQLGAGARVFPDDAVVGEGQTVVVALGFLLMTVLAPCRVVYVIEENDRFAYAYGTLTSHPEQGEERFLVQRTDAGARFEILAFSRPVHPLARLGRPVATLMQNRVNNRYLAAIKARAT